jgi:hypothetical protein
METEFQKGHGEHGGNGEHGEDKEKNVKKLI